MDKEVGSVFASFLLMTGIFSGVNYIVLEDQEIGFMGWAIFAIGAAIGIWWWLNHQAEEATKATEAENAMREAEAKAAELNAAAQASLQTPTPATDVVEQVGEATEDVVETVENTADEASDIVEAENSTANASTDRDAGSDEADDTSLERNAEPDETVEAETPGEDIDADEDTPVDTTSEQPDEVVEPTELKEENKVDSTVDGEPDDLTKVEGIGPYYQRILHESDVTTFAGLASLSEADIAQLIQDAGGRRSNTIATWAEQAALAAAGDWAGLAKLQDELNGGRRG